MKTLAALLIAPLIYQGTLHATPAEVVGPYVGAVSQQDAHLLYRPGALHKQLRLDVRKADGKVVATADAQSLKENDYVAKFHVTGLQPGTTYHYAISEVGTSSPLIAGDTYHFTTVAPTRRGTLKVAFISCVNQDTIPVWEEMQTLGIDALCLAGDTPYIDTASLPIIRQKHRALLQTEALAALGKNTSVLGNWDDHDFGANNGNGKSFENGKPNTRKGFVEYRANASFGNGQGAGVYHQTDHGAIEIFHLDARTFSQTGPSPVDPSQPTCFGNDQWEWLLQGLKESKAPFKVLSMGAIWQDKKNGETDDMFT